MITVSDRGEYTTAAGGVGPFSAMLDSGAIAAKTGVQTYLWMELVSAPETEYQQAVCTLSGTGPYTITINRIVSGSNGRSPVNFSGPVKCRTNIAAAQLQQQSYRGVLCIGDSNMQSNSAATQNGVFHADEQLIDGLYAWGLPSYTDTTKDFSAGKAYPVGVDPQNSAIPNIIWSNYTGTGTGISSGGALCKAMIENGDNDYLPVCMIPVARVASAISALGNISSYLWNAPGYPSSYPNPGGLLTDAISACTSFLSNGTNTLEVIIIQLGSNDAVNATYTSTYDTDYAAMVSYLRTQLSLITGVSPNQIPFDEVPVLVLGITETDPGTSAATIRSKLINTINLIPHSAYVDPSVPDTIASEAGNEIHFQGRELLRYGYRAYDALPAARANTLTPTAPAVVQWDATTPLVVGTDNETITVNWVDDTVGFPAPTYTLQYREPGGSAPYTSWATVPNGAAISQGLQTFDIVFDGTTLDGSGNAMPQADGSRSFDFQIQATNASGSSPSYSTVQSGVPLAIVAIAPAVVQWNATTPIVIGTDNQTITVNWIDDTVGVPNPTYTLQYKEPGGSAPYTSWADVPNGSAIAYGLETLDVVFDGATLDGSGNAMPLADGVRSFDFQIQATNASGSSAYSTTQSGVPLGISASYPTLLFQHSNDVITGNYKNSSGTTDATVDSPASYWKDGGGGTIARNMQYLYASPFLRQGDLAKVGAHYLLDFNTTSATMVTNPGYTAPFTVVIQFGPKPTTPAVVPVGVIYSSGNTASKLKIVGTQLQSEAGNIDLATVSGGTGGINYQFAALTYDGTNAKLRYGILDSAPSARTAKILATVSAAATFSGATWQAFGNNWAGTDPFYGSILQQRSFAADITDAELLLVVETDFAEVY